MQLRNTTGPQEGNKPSGFISIGNVVRQLMDNRVSPRHAVFDSINELWCRLLPAELVQHTRIADISGGQLKVQVDSPSYMYELQLCSSGLLGELRRRCPQVRVKEIRFVLA